MRQITAAYCPVGQEISIGSSRAEIHSIERSNHGDAEKVGSMTVSIGGHSPQFRAEQLVIVQDQARTALYGGQCADGVPNESFWLFSPSDLDGHILVWIHTRFSTSCGVLHLKYWSH